MRFPQQGSQEAPPATGRWLEGQPSQCQGFLHSFIGIQVSRTIAMCLRRKCKTTAKVRELHNVYLEGLPLSDPVQLPRRGQTLCICHKPCSALGLCAVLCNWGPQVSVKSPHLNVLFLY